MGYGMADGSVVSALHPFFLSSLKGGLLPKCIKSEGWHLFHKQPKLQATKNIQNWMRFEQNLRRWLEKCSFFLLVTSHGPLSLILSRHGTCTWRGGAEHMTMNCWIYRADKCCLHMFYIHVYIEKRHTNSSSSMFQGPAHHFLTLAWLSSGLTVHWFKVCLWRGEEGAGVIVVWAGAGRRCPG